ncbi:hypothetical protein PR048_001324 [Dryococelus australis]|uniref:Uncharacterized protein n=1 Tax=Dryococelus australis TaxID=614101 RepID=A0ABQ9IH09_9NEOP|nr:hypothetical protein PR048_001324 [Dryococelus australis]
MVWGHCGVVVRLLASHLCEPGSIPDDAGWGGGSLGISRFPRPFIPALLHTHLVSPTSALKTWMLRTAQVSLLAHLLGQVTDGAHQAPGRTTRVITRLGVEVRSCRPGTPSNLSQTRTPGTSSYDVWFVYAFRIPIGSRVLHIVSVKCDRSLCWAVCSTPVVGVGRSQECVKRGIGDPGSIPGRVTPDFRVWESCQTMPLVGGYSRGSPVFSLALSYRRCSILSSITLIGSQDLDVNSRPNLFTHFFRGLERTNRPSEGGLCGQANSPNIRKIVLWAVDACSWRITGFSAEHSFWSSSGRNGICVLDLGTSPSGQGVEGKGWGCREQCQTLLPVVAILPEWRKIDNEGSGLRRDVQGVLTSGLCVLCGLERETSSARREIQLLQPNGWYKGPSTPPALSFGNDEILWDGTPRPRSRSEGAIRATLTRTPSASSLLRASTVLTGSRPVTNFVHCIVVFDEVWTNRTVVDGNGETNSTDFPVVDIGPPFAELSSHHKGSHLMPESYNPEKHDTTTPTRHRHGGNTARLARRSDEALEVRVSVARIAQSLLHLGRAATNARPFYKTVQGREWEGCACRNCSSIRQEWKWETCFGKKSPPIEPPTAAFIPVHAGSFPHFRPVWGTCRTMPLVGGFPRESPAPLAIALAINPHRLSRPRWNMRGLAVTLLNYQGPVAPSWFETQSELGSKIDTENCCTIPVQSWTGDRDEIHFEPPKLVVRKLDPRSAVIVDEFTLWSEIHVHGSGKSRARMGKYPHDAWISSVLSHEVVGRTRGRNNTMRPVRQLVGHYGDRGEVKCGKGHQRRGQTMMGDCETMADEFLGNAGTVKDAAVICHKEQSQHSLGAILEKPLLAEISKARPGIEPMPSRIRVHWFTTALSHSVGSEMFVHTRRPSAPAHT